jgi:hypothetical protein
MYPSYNFTLTRFQVCSLKPPYLINLCISHIISINNAILLTFCLKCDTLFNEGASALFHRPAMGERPTGHDRELARGELFDQVDTDRNET